jgi:hypothetical protein
VNVTGAGANALSVTGTSTLGNAGVVADQALVVNGNATFNENVNVVGTLSSGNFAPANITTPGNLQVDGNTTLGNGAGDVLTVTGTSTFNGPATVTGNTATSAVTLL